jgi:CRP-like cAMP-binding protein
MAHKIAVMKLTEFFLQLFQLPDEAITEIMELAVPFTYNENEYILKPGTICDRVFYIETGIIREFEELSIDTDTERTKWIMGEGSWLYSVESFLTDKPSKFYIQALCPTKGYYFLKSDVENLIKTFEKFRSIETLLYKDYLLKMEYRNQLHRTKDAKERLAFFEKQQPELINRVKQKHVASYLNIEFSSLSRIRGELLRKSKP